MMYRAIIGSKYSYFCICTLITFQFGYVVLLNRRIDIKWMMYRAIIGSKYSFFYICTLKTFQLGYVVTSSNPRNDI